MRGPGRYARAFKLEAVRVMQQGEKPAAQVAMELGVKRTLLYRWRDEVAAQGEAAFRGQPGPQPALVATELARLKRELAVVTAERDLLKKAAAYFANALR
jgi:transposase